MSRAKNNPQSYSEMVLSAEEKRAASGLYEGDDTDMKLSALVAASAEELAAIIDSGTKISLTDTEEVQRRGVTYLRACSEGACLPSMTGYARSMGMTARALNDFKQRNPTHPTSDFLQMLHDTMADLLADAAVRNGSGINTIFAIFLEKARFSWRDNTVIEFKTTDKNPFEPDLSAEAIASKYSELPED